MWIERATVTIILAFHFIVPVATECDSTQYEITTTGISDAAPNPVFAFRGVPFFPECEPNSRKHFRVKSGSDVAIFLAGTSQIYDRYTQDFYQIALETDGVVSIVRDGTVLEPESSSPAANLLSATDFVDLWVSVVEKDSTIHVGRKDGGELASWKDTNLIDIKYILVQNYNDGNGDEALWEFCDGDVKLLSQNGASGQTVMAVQRETDDDKPGATAENAIDGDTNDGIFDEDKCIALGDRLDDDAMNDENRTADTEEVDADVEKFAWWRIDLKDMYQVKLVSIANSLLNPADAAAAAACPAGWRQYGPSCFFEGVTEMNWDQAEADCVGRGGHLATITTAGMQDFLMDWLDTAPDTDEGYWIGLRDDVEDTFTWADGTPGFQNSGGVATPSNYFTYWTTGRPENSGGDQDCVQMREPDQLKWNDRHCTDVIGKYICQISLCDDGWLLYGEHCYFLGTDPMSWTDAQTACGDEDGHLVTVDSAEKQAFMVAWLDPESSEDDYWAGLYETAVDSWEWDAGDSDAFTWSGGAGGSATPSTAFTFWGPSQPNHYNAPTTPQCLELREDGTSTFDDLAWNDQECTTTLKYICQKFYASDSPATSSDQHLAGAEVLVGSCDHTVETDGSLQLPIIKKNEACGSPLSMDETAPDRAASLLFRECDTNYYGQYVYILKEATPLAWFSLCEVEVWGIDISDENKPKIGFTQQDVSNVLEGDLNTQPITIMRTDGSKDHPTCLGFSLEALPGLAPTAVINTDYTHADIALTTSTDPLEYTFCPGDPSTMTFDITFMDNDCIEEDRMVGFRFSRLSKGLCAGDADDNTYDTITYTMVNDDVKYYWEDSTLTVQESDGTVTGVLRREGYLQEATTAEVTTADNTAAAGTDFEGITAGTSESEVEFPATESSADVVVQILEDDLCELPPGSKDFTLVVAEDPDACVVRGDNLTITIKHDDAIFRFQQVTYEVTETARTVEVVVEREGYIDVDAMIDVQSQPSDPRSAMPEDYTAIDTTLTIPAGRTAASLTVTVTDDNLVEGDETFQLVLVRNPLSLPTCVIDGGETTITIKDDDCCWRMMNEEVSITEGSSPATITVLCERDDGIMLDISRTAMLEILPSATSEGTPATSGEDFTRSSPTAVVVKAGETMGMINIQIVDDISEEVVEYLDVSLLSSDDGEIKEPSTTQVTINDDDVTVRLTTCDTDGSMILENAGALTVTVDRTGDLSESDTVIIFTNPQTATTGSSAGVGDFVGINEVVSLAALQSTASRDIIINDDADYESDETFVVQLKKQSEDTFVDTTIARCIVTIKDDDCSFSLSIDNGERIVSENVGDITFTITRSGYISHTTRVFIGTSSLPNAAAENDAESDKDYEGIEQRVVVFDPEQKSQSFTINVIDDPFPEINEYFLVSLSGTDCTSEDNVIVIGIEDDDEVKISMQDSSVTVGESEGSALITVLRTGSLARTDTVTLSVHPKAVEGTSSAATINSDFDNSDITFTFQQSEDRRVVEVPIFDNEMEEVGLESFIVSIKEVKQNPDGAISVTDATIDNDNRETIVYIRDDDGTFSLRSLGRYSESVGSVVITMDRTGPTTTEEIVYISTRDIGASIADYQSLQSVPLRFPASASTASVTVVIHDDKELEPSEDFLVCWSTEANREREQCVEIVTILDDDNEVRFKSTSGSADKEIVSESDGVVRLTVQRSGYGSSLPTGMTTVTITTRQSTGFLANGATPADGNGVDYKDVSQTLTFTDRETELDIQIEVVDDDIGENQEAFEVVLTNVSPDGNNLIVYPTLVTVYIGDDDGGTTGGDDGDGSGDGGDGSSGTELSNAIIVGIGGGVGLLVLVSVLGLIGCVALSRYNQPSAPITRTTSVPQRALRGPPPTTPVPTRALRGPPPSYYATNTTFIPYGQSP